jgi:periplasmic copper chaperone A
MSRAQSPLARARDAIATRPGGPPHPGILAAAVAVVVGLAGLWYGLDAGRDPGPATGGGAAAVSPSAAPTSADVGGVTATGDIVVRGAYFRPSKGTASALAYLTMTNTGQTPDTMTSIYCGAASSTDFYGPADRTTPSVRSRQSTGTFTVQGGQTVKLGPAGGGRIALTKLAGALRAGDSVSVLLTFRRSGQVLVDVPVIAADAPLPDGAGP